MTFNLFFLIDSNNLSVFFRLEVLPVILIVFVVILIESICKLTCFAQLLKASSTRVSFAAAESWPVTLIWPPLRFLICLNTLPSFLTGLSLGLNSPPNVTDV